MPIADFVQFDDFTQLITWEVSENNIELLNSLNLTVERQEKHRSLSQKRQQEYLGLRACLKALNIETDVLYGEKGNPYLPCLHKLSITHSYGMVAVGLSEFRIGVDIELERVDKICNIRKKFIRPDEDLWLSKKKKITDYLHIIWGIKESLYKLNGGTLWSFLHHYKVESFDLVENQSIQCWTSSPEKSRKYFAYYKKIQNYFLVWVVDYE